MYEYKAELARVVDGDTVDLRVDLGFNMTANIRFRIKGIDTPEVRGPEKIAGLAAKAYVVDLLSSTDELTVSSTKTGKYGRWLGSIGIKTPEGQLDLAKELIDTGHAKEYGK